MSIKTRALLPNQTQHNDISKSRKNQTVLDGSEFDTASKRRTEIYKKRNRDEYIEEIKLKNGEQRDLHVGLVTDVLATISDVLTPQERVGAYAKFENQNPGEIDRLKQLYNVGGKKPNNVIDLFR